MALEPNSNAAQEVSDQEEYLQLLRDGPIADLAKYVGCDLDTAVKLRVDEAVDNTYRKLEAAPLQMEAQVRLIEPKGKLIGFANVKFGGGFVVEDFAVLQSEKGLFVGSPSKPDGKGGYRETAHPITPEARTALTQAVEKGYREAVQKLQARAAAVAAEQSEPMEKRLADGAKQAAAHNATRPPKGKGKAQSAELGG